jgi:hypothetical protein
VQGGLAWHQEHIAGLAGGPSYPGSALQPGSLKTGSSWMSRRRFLPRAAATKGGRRDRHQSLQPRQRTQPRSPATGSARRSPHSAHYLHQARPDLVPEGVEGIGFQVPVRGREHVGSSPAAGLACHAGLVSAGLSARGRDAAAAAGAPGSQARRCGPPGARLRPRRDRPAIPRLPGRAPTRGRR